MQQQQPLPTTTVGYQLLCKGRKIYVIGKFYVSERKIPLCSAFRHKVWRFLLVKLGHVTVLLSNICAHFMFRRDWFESLFKIGT